MYKSELIKALCLPDEITGDIAKIQLERALASIPEDINVGEIRNQVEAALNTVFGLSSQSTILNLPNDPLAAMWQSYSQRLSRLLDENQRA